ncbi:MAG: hypothetical protein WEG36_11015 [Gemmatimonadota bacterium]
MLIEQSLASLELLAELSIVGTEKATLEGEEARGEFSFHRVEVENRNLSRVAALAVRDLLPTWYFHLVRDGVMHVFFKDRFFEAHRDDSKSFSEIRAYAIAVGIHADQLPLETLMIDPFA